jgi:hypothetical protein
MMFWTAPARYAGGISCSASGDNSGQPQRSRPSTADERADLDSGATAGPRGIMQRRRFRPGYPGLDTREAECSSTSETALELEDNRLYT